MIYQGCNFTMMDITICEFEFLLYNSYYFSWGMNLLAEKKYSDSA